MNKSKDTFKKFKKLFQKKKKVRNEKITRYDLILLDAKYQQMEIEATISQHSSHNEIRTSNET